MLTFREEFSSNDISGNKLPYCNSGIVEEGICITPTEICDGLDGDFDDENWAGPEVQRDVSVCPDNFNCCVPGRSGPVVVADIPWACALRLGETNENIKTMKGGYIFNGNGFWCGGNHRCKLVFCGGDPHFKTWADEWFDFHGECDLKFMEVPEFGLGLGLTIDIRTKARYEYSFIESAAIKIGDDVLEVGEYGQYFLNGVEAASLQGAMLAGLYPITYEQSEDGKSTMFSIHTHQGPADKKEVIQLKSFKDLVSVKIENAYEQSFGASIGLMGDYYEGKRLSRDGSKVISDDIEFGMEWQVKADEPKLFQVNGEWEQCRMPSKDASAERRRLGAGISEEAAEAACAKVDHINHDSCVYDVMATGDLESAQAGVF